MGSHARAVQPSAEGVTVTTTVAAHELPLRIIEAESTPLYLQIVHQLKQLIMTGELADGVQLPAVRPLASHLGVNPGTVMQAYRQLAGEGLTASIRGRGSVVRTLSGRSNDALVREQVLDGAVARLALRARALGFEPAETLQRVSAGLLSPRGPVPVVFLGVTAAQARRYTEELNERFGGDEVTFVPYSMADVLARDAALIAELDTAYTVLAFAPRVPEVERAFDELGIAVEIIGVRAELSQSSHRWLSRLRPEVEYTLITEKRAVTTVLALLDAEHVQVLACDEGEQLDAERLAEVVRGKSTIIYSFGVRDLVLSLPVPEQRLLALEFEFTESTWHELTRRWGPARRPAVNVEAFEGV